MSADELYQRANRVFKKTFGDNTPDIHPAMTAQDVDKWDSINHMVLISGIEQEFGIKFKLKELVSMKNVGDLLQLITAKTTA